MAKEKFKAQTYQWVKLINNCDGKGTAGLMAGPVKGGMLIKLGLNDSRMRVVGWDGNVIEMEGSFSAVTMVREMLEAKDYEMLYNELLFMLNTVLHFSNENMRTMLFSITDLNYYLLNNQLESPEMDALKEAVSQGEGISAQMDLDRRHKLVEHYKIVEELALMPLDEVYAVMQKIKMDRRDAIEAQKAEVQNGS